MLRLDIAMRYRIRLPIRGLFIMARCLRSESRISTIEYNLSENLMKRYTVAAFCFLLALISPAHSLAISKAEARERAQKASQAFQEIMAAPDQSIPQDLLDHAHCIAVFPSVKKGGFVFGGQYGKGLISCRRQGGSWGSPAYFTIGGGSFGL